MWELLVRRTSTCLLLVLFGSVVHAESGPPGGDRTLDLKEAVAKTMAANPELLAFGYELEAQDGRVLQAGLAPNPVVALHCGSMSINKVRLPARPNAAARLIEVVVLPTPPFWFAMHNVVGNGRFPEGALMLAELK